MQIKLTDNMSKYFDIYYRMHVANKGWLGWAKNGEIAGTTGGSIRAEAIQIKIVEKNSTFNKGSAAYIKYSKIKLKNHMATSLKQGDYSAFTKPYGDNRGCCAMAYAIGLSIVTSKSYNPTSFWDTTVGTTYYSAGHAGNYESYNAQKIYEALKAGKPTMINYRYANGNEHWVLIIGANDNTCSQSSFVCIDPAYGDERLLTSCYSFYQIKGMKIMY